MLSAWRVNGNRKIPIMTISCPHCQKPHRLPEGRLPDRKAAVRCKGCGQRFILDRGAEPPLPQIQSAAAGIGGTSGNDTGQATTPAEIRVTEDDFSAVTASPSPPDLEITPVLADDECGLPDDSPTTKILRSFPQLRELPAEHFTLAELLTPTPEGSYQTRPNRFKARLLLATAELLTGKILQPGEQVGRIARGSAYFPFEIPYANGLLTLPTNYYALVATTYRLLLINLDFRGNRPVRYTFQVLYDEIGKISRGLLGTSLLIRIKTGGKWNFTTVKRTLARDLAAFVQARLKTVPSGFYDGIPRRQLCPGCLTPLAGGLVSCPVCRVSFKTAREAMKRSLLLPGMGEIYLGHYFPGISIMAGYLLTWLVAIILIIVDLAGGLRGAGFMLLVSHLFAGLLARRLGYKGYLADLSVPPAPAPPPVETDGQPILTRQEPESISTATPTSINSQPPSL